MVKTFKELSEVIEDGKELEKAIEEYRNAWQYVHIVASSDRLLDFTLDNVSDDIIEFSRENEIVENYINLEIYNRLNALERLHEAYISLGEYIKDNVDIIVDQKEC